MVFFTCNACGSSLKKNQVEKHYRNECRSCNVLSCMDCGQDFYGDDYASHTKCISEAEKYQGAMYKASDNKGDCKQEAWLKKAREAMQSAKVSSKLVALLERIADYPNIPRKKKKFENFIGNSLNVRDQATLDELWRIFNTEPESSALQSSEGAKGEEVTSHNDIATNGNSETRPAEEGAEEVEKEGEKAKKRKKKLACNGSTESNGSITNEATTVQEGTRNGSTKSAAGSSCELVASSGMEELKTTKRKKKKHDTKESVEENGVNDVVINETVMKKQKKRKKLECTEKTTASSKRQKLDHVVEACNTHKHSRTKKKHKKA